MRRVLIPLFAAVLFGAQLSPAVACSCVPQSKAQLAENATVIFTGTVTARSWISGLTSGCTPGGSETVTLTFAVESVFKGDAARTVSVSTYANGAACGYEFAGGKRYTVFATASGDRLDTNLCRGNVEGEIVAAEYGLGTPHPPK